MQKDIGVVPKPLPGSSFLIERCTIQPDLNRVVTHDGRITHLEPKVMQLLVFMAERPEAVLARDTLLNAIWGDAFVTEQVLTNAISLIRQSFGDAGRDYLQTIPKKGYRLTARVLPESTPLSLEPQVSFDNEFQRAQPNGKRRIWTSWTGVFMALCLGSVIAVISSYTFWRHSPAGKAASGIHSIAVLPLENLSGDPEQKYLVDGIHDELTSKLGRIAALDVRSRTSTMHYRSADKTVPAIARELKVDAVLEGSVRRSGKRLSITLQLIEAATDRQLWSKTYERDLTDVLQTENEIAAEVASEVNATLTPAERSRFASARGVNPEAYDAYLRGRYYTAQVTVDSVPKAIAEFELAIAKDPSFAAAYAGLAYLYVQAPGRQVPGLNDRRAMELAEGAANRALELDPDSAEAHTAAGGVRLATFRPHTAEREFRRALQLNPNSADAEVMYAITLVRLERPKEAVEHADRAVELDPNSASTNWYAGLAYLYAGENKHGGQLRRVLELDPNFPMAHFALAWRDASSGKGSGKCDNEHLRLAGRNPERLAFLAYCYGKTGRMDEAKRAFHQMETDPNFPNMYPRMLAYAYIGLGDKEKAIAVMQRAFDDRTPWFDEILLGKCELDPDPRFQAIKQQVRALYAEDK